MVSQRGGAGRLRLSGAIGGVPGARPRNRAEFVRSAPLVSGGEKTGNERFRRAGAGQSCNGLSELLPKPVIMSSRLRFLTHERAGYDLWHHQQMDRLSAVGLRAGGGAARG